MSFPKPMYQFNVLIDSSNPRIKEYYKSFTSHHDGDSGVDLYNFEDIPVNFLSVGTVNFKIKCEMIDLTTNEYTSYYLVPRSSLSKTSFQLANSVGIIDAGYRGNLMAKVRCFDENGAVLHQGAHFQIVGPNLKPIKVSVVDYLSDTSRNDGGFGSTDPYILLNK
jgi:dUTP pyrophosphatase